MITKERLNAHAEWLVDNTKGERLDLSHSNLSCSDLSHSNLSCSDLSHSDLRGSDLSHSNLRDSNLSCSDLSHSDLSCSDLSHSNLRDSNLIFSDLRGSNLRGSDLRGSDLSFSDLRGSDLRGSKGITMVLDGCYEMYLIHGDTPMIKAGCRWFTISEATAHWSAGNEAKWTKNTAAYGESQRAMLAYLVSRIGAANHG